MPEGTESLQERRDTGVQERLAERTRLHALLDQVPAGALLLDEAGARIAAGNQLGRTLFQLACTCAGQATCAVHDAVRHTARTGEPVSLETRGPGGSILVIEVRDAGLGRPDERVALSIRDVTPERAMQEALIRNERLAVLGQVTAGVAHEINNPAAYALASAQEVRERLREVARGEGTLEGLDELLADCEEGLTRIGGLVQDLRDYGHCARRRDEDVDVNDLVRANLKVFGRVAVVFEPAAAPLPPVRGDRARLSQVLLNLITNAVQAVAVEDRSARPVQVATALDPTTGEVLVAVRDQGAGIAPPHLGRIFEPFYTTKAPGQGTGLGLSISRDIVRSHGGDITVTTEVGKGSLFTVRLPAVAVAPTAPRGEA